MCTAFSAWQHISTLKRDPSIVSREYVRAMVHIRFCMELNQMQHDAGRYFIHEYPSSATSWAEPEVRRIMQVDGVRVASADQCQYNAINYESWGTIEEADALHDEQFLHCRSFEQAVLWTWRDVFEGEPPCLMQRPAGQGCCDLSF